MQALDKQHAFLNCKLHGAVATERTANRCASDDAYAEN